MNLEVRKGERNAYIHFSSTVADVSFVSPHLAFYLFQLISGPTPMSNFGHSTYNMNSFSASKSRPGPGPPPKLSLPPLNLFQNQIAGNSNAPYTPGGSYFSGARDGAASGEPLSPFEPPTPLKKMSGDGKDFNNSNPMDSPLNRYAKLSFVGPIGSASQMMDGVAGSPTGSSSAHAHALSRLQRKRPSLPPALGGRGLARRASDSPSSQSYSVGSIPPYGQQQESLPVPVSPLSKEFANVNVGAGINGDGEMQVDATGMDSDEHMRTLTRSSVDAVMGLRQLNEEAAVASYSSNGPQSAATSPSTVSVNSMSTTATSDFTPPCSPLEFSQGASISKQKQRSASPMATDMRRTSSGNKPRAKESFIGSNMSPSNQAHSMTTRAKKSQQSATTATSSHSVKSRSVSPPSLELPSGLSKQVNVEVQMPSSAPPTQTTFGSSITGIPSSQGAMTLSPPIEKQSLPVLRAVPMAKSNSAPAPMTVSAKHLSNKDLNPRFVESYELTDELGSGGFGFVVSARRRSDDLKVAVKFIFKNKVPSHGWVRDPQLGIVPMELFVLKVVNSPFVVKFIEAFDDSEFFYLVMEHHGSPWVANTKENKAAAASALAAKDKQPKAPAMKSSKSLPGSRPPVASSTPIKSIAAFTLAADSPTVAVFAPNSNTPSLTSDSEMSDSEPGSRSSVSNSSSSPSAPSRPGMPQRRLSCDLFECIEQHSKLGETNARWVFAQVVEAVYHLDRMGISHRDIKDENCVVDSDFNVKLIDFGSAVISDVRKPAPFFNRFFGTMTFAASEILKGQPYRAPNAEVWSLGVLLSILLSGECPFEDPKAAMEGRIAHGKGWSREAKEIIHGCLEVDPDRRANIREVRDHPWVRKAWREQGRERPQ